MEMNSKSSGSESAGVSRLMSLNALTWMALQTKPVGEDLIFLCPKHCKERYGQVVNLLSEDITLKARGFCAAEPDAPRTSNYLDDD